MTSNADEGGADGDRWFQEEEDGLVPGHRDVLVLGVPDIMWGVRKRRELPDNTLELVEGGDHKQVPDHKAGIEVTEEEIGTKET